MNYRVYILWSPSLSEHYTGFSKVPGKRLRQHRGGKAYWTRRADDWEEVWREEVETRVAARQLEKRIKSRGAARFLSDGKRTPLVPLQV